MPPILWVCLGGALGSGARYLVGGLCARVATGGFPLGTFAVNVVGSFLIALLAEGFLSLSPLHSPARLFLTTGLMGGFTTYSSFNHETLKALHAGSYALALGYAAATFVGCLAAGALGMWVLRVAGR